MVVLTAMNLGEKQRELNLKVIQSVSSNVDFEQLRNTAEENDIDKLYKIDVASKYKNVDYIIEVLKSGDPLHVSRALKCDWLFSDDFSNVINVDYLHQNVFPFMSTKMKKKFLSTMSLHVTNNSRAAAFYAYCWDIKLTNIGFKFLLNTSESFKLEWLSQDLDKTEKIVTINNWLEYTKYFIGHSFKLADIFLARFTGWRNQIAYELRYLYSVSNEKYLDLIEKYDKYASYSCFQRFGLRLTKNIVTKHKQRVINNIHFYVTILNHGTLAKHSNAEDAKAYLTALLKEYNLFFWNYDFCKTYRFIIDLIPIEERFGFIKKIFYDKYPRESFETTITFYNKEYYTLMTKEVRETWALSQVASGSEILGAGNEYKWYQFVNFGKAFVEIKKFIMITTDKNKRLEMVNVLAKTAETQRDLEKLFNYFYERHVNELTYLKEIFIDGILCNHNPFAFDENCWTAINKIFYSLEVYSVTGYHNTKMEYRTIVLVYHIIKNKEVPEAMVNYIDTCLNMYSLRTHYTDKLTKEEEELVFQYLLNFYMNKLNTIYNTETDSEKMKHDVRKYIHFILDILETYKRTEKDCPEIVMTLMQLDWEEFKYHSLLNKVEDPEPVITQHTFLRFLKQDATLVVGNLPKLKDNFEDRSNLIIDLFLKKLKVYYPNDLTDQCIEFFKELLSAKEISQKVARAAVNGIFHLASDNFKAEFMQKHAPTEVKIDHAKIDQKLLYIQQAICAFARVSRPPVPLKNLLLYIKGDYVHHSLSTFDSYLANLPPALFIDFVEATLNTPLSTQKHGLRLAFECFDTDNLVKLLKSAWKKTKNVSLRMILYNALFKKILEVETQTQMQLYEALKVFTLDLHQDDDEEVFQLLTSNRLPEYILGDYIETAWTTVSKLPQKIINLRRIGNLLHCMEYNFHLIRKEIIQAITDEHIKEAFKETIEAGDNVETCNNEKYVLLQGIIRTKWLLVTKYITCINSEEDLAAKLEITKFVMNQCISKWNEVHDGKYSVRKLCLQFIEDVDRQGFVCDVTCYLHVNVIIKNILEMIQNAFPVEEIYILTWKLQLNRIARKLIAEGKINMNSLWDIGNNFAKEFVILLKQFIDEGIYYVTFLEDIKSQVVDAAAILSNRFNNMMNVVNFEDFRVAICHGLIHTKMPEANMYALKILPLDYERIFKDEYKQLYNELKSIEDKEFRCNMYKKFVNSDLRYRI